MDKARNLIGALISSQSSSSSDIPRVRSMMTKGKLRLSVLEARNLIDATSQNAVRVYLNLVGQTFTTKSKATSSLDGTFIFENDLLFFSISDRDVLRHLSLSVEVASSADMMGSRSSLGRVLIPLNDIVCKHQADDWFSLDGVEKGEVRLSWTYHGTAVDSYSGDVSAIEAFSSSPMTKGLAGRHGSVLIRDVPKPFRTHRLSSVGSLSPGQEPLRSSRTQSIDLLGKLKAISDHESSHSPADSRTNSLRGSLSEMPIMSPALTFTSSSMNRGRRASSMMIAAMRSAARRREMSISSSHSNSSLPSTTTSSSSSSSSSLKLQQEEPYLNTLGFDDNILGDEIVANLPERMNAFKHDRCCEKRANHTFQNNYLLSHLKSSRRSLNALRSAAWDGIPMYLRSTAWPLLADAQSHAASAFMSVIGYKYRQLIHATVDDLGTQPKLLHLCLDAIQSTNPSKEILKDINKDVPRTFAGHNTRVNTAHGQAALSLLLRANALYSPAIGYAQSLNIMTAFLLSVNDMKLGDAFWLLVTITTIHARAYHVPSMGGFLLDTSVLTRLCQDHLPRIYDHMTRHQVPMLMIANRSLLSGLVLCIPTRSLLRIFDIMFVHGTSIWISVLLCVMKQFREDLLRTRSPGQFLTVLRTCFLRCYHADHLMRNVFEMFESIREHVEQHRMESVPSATNEAAISLVSRVSRRLCKQTYSLSADSISSLCHRYIRVAVALARIDSSNFVVAADGLRLPIETRILRRCLGTMTSFRGQIGHTKSKFNLNVLAVQRVLTMLQFTMEKNPSSFQIEVFVVAVLLCMHQKCEEESDDAGIHSKSDVLRRFQSSGTPPILLPSKNCENCMVDITNDSHSRVCESCNAKYCKECKGICMLKIGKKKWRHRFCQHDSRRSRIEDEEDEEKLWRTFPLSNRALLRLIYNVTGTTKSVLDFARAYGKMTHTPAISSSTLSTSSQESVSNTISSFEMFQELCEDKSSIVSSWYRLIMSPPVENSSSSSSSNDIHSASSFCSSSKKIMKNGKPVVLPSWFPSQLTLHEEDDEMMNVASPGTQIIQQYKVQNQAIMGESDTSMIRNALLDALVQCPIHAVALGAHIDLLFPRPVTLYKIYFTVLENASLALSKEKLSILKGFELQCKDHNNRWIRVLKINDVISSCTVMQTGAIRHCELRVSSSFCSMSWRLKNFRGAEDSVLGCCFWNFDVDTKASIEEKRENDDDDDDEEDEKEKEFASSAGKSINVESTVLDGWLLKRGRRYLKNWTRRYIRVLSNGVVQYYRNPQDSQPRGTFSITSTSSIEHCVKDKKIFAFRVKTDNVDVYLAASSAAIRDQWIASLENVAAVLSSVESNKLSSKLSSKTLLSTRRRVMTSEHNVPQSLHAGVEGFVWFDMMEWSSSQRRYDEDRVNLKRFFCVLDSHIAVPKLRIAESRTLERCTSRTLRGCSMQIEAEPKMVMISQRRGRRYYTILLTNQSKKILRLYFETTQIRNRWATSIAEAIDPGVSGWLRVQQIPGAHDTGSAQWKSRYFELRKNHEAIYLFRSQEDRVEANCLSLDGYVVRPVIESDRQHRQILTSRKSSSRKDTRRKWKRREIIRMIQLWHPRLPMYNLCLDCDDASWYRSFLSALSNATHSRGGKLLMDSASPPISTTTTKIIRSL